MYPPEPPHDRRKQKKLNNIQNDEKAKQSKVTLVPGLLIYNTKARK
jgi:hypothetical protein